MLTSYGFEPFVDMWKQVGNRLFFAAHAGAVEPRPAPERMEAESAFVTQPTLVHFDIPSSNRPIDLAVRRRVPGNTAANRTRRMIDAQVAAGAASGTDRVCAFEEPDTSFESEIAAGQRTHRT